MENLFGAKCPARGARKIKEMQSKKPQERFSNSDSPAATADDFDAARQRVQSAFEEATKSLIDQGVPEKLATMFQANPLSAETAFSNNIMKLFGEKLSNPLEGITADFDPSLKVEKEK